MRRLVLFLLVLSAASALKAQTGDTPRLPEAATNTQRGVSTVQGQVRLPNGKPVSSVRVGLISLSDGQVRQTETDPTGYFYFLNLPTGDYQYEVAVTVPGYAPVHQRVISCDMAPVSLFVSLVSTDHGGSNANGETTASNPAIPEQARTLFAKGLSEMREGKAAQANDYFTKAVKVYPLYFEGYLMSAEAYTDERQFPEAQKMIDQALHLYPASSAAIAQRGFLRMEEGKLGAAEKDFNHAIRLNSSQWLAQLELGRMLLDQKRAQAAYPHLTAAHSLRPDLPSSHLLLYDDLILLNRKPEALAQLNEFLARFPKAPQAAKLLRVRAALQAVVLQASSRPQP